MIRLDQSARIAGYVMSGEYLGDQEDTPFDTGHCRRPRIVLR